MVINNSFNCNFILIVLAIAGNKDDLVGEEIVSEEEVNELAKNLGAIFIRTSAKESYGINELFNDIGKKLLEPKPIANQVKEDKNSELNKNNPIANQVKKDNNSELNKNNPIANQVKEDNNSELNKNNSNEKCCPCCSCCHWCPCC